MITAHKKIAGAFVVGLGLIILAYFLSASNQTEPPKAITEPVVVDSAPREYIAVTDGDSDGVPDWQEALQQTDPIVINQEKTDYEVPDTLTDQFAVDFFQKMVRAENQGEFGFNQEELIAQATADFQEEVTDELFTEKDIVISRDNSEEAVRAYLIGIYNIMLDYPVPADTPNELDTLAKAYRSNEESELEALKPQIESYKNIIEDTKKLPVPSNYTSLHLSYVNVLNAVYNDISAMEMAFSDPLYSFLRLKRYQEDIEAMPAILLEIETKALTDNVVIKPEDLDIGQ